MPTFCSGLCSLGTGLKWNQFLSSMCRRIIIHTLFSKKHFLRYTWMEQGNNMFLTVNFEVEIWKFEILKWQVNVHKFKNIWRFDFQNMLDFTVKQIFNDMCVSSIWFQRDINACSFWTLFQTHMSSIIQKLNIIQWIVS